MGRTLPVTPRLALVIAGVIALLLAGVAVAVWRQAQHQREVTDAATAQAQILAETVPAALSFDDTKSLGQYVAAVRADPRIATVGVYDAQGDLAAGRSDLALPRTLAAARRADPAHTRIRVFAPVTQNHVILGEVLIGYRPESLAQSAMRYVGPGLLVIMASLMFTIMGLDSRALIRANRELKREIAERAQAEEALRQSQKMEAIGRLTGGIAHDFNNMLGIVMGSLDLISRRVPEDDTRIGRLVENALEGTRRAAALTHRLLAFSRLQPLNPTSVDVSKVLKDTTEMLRRTLGEPILIESVSAAGLWRAHIDAPQLESAIVNLGINARDAMPDGGKLTLETANIYLDRAYADAAREVTAGQYVLVAITDTGTGMTPEVMAQVFEPFFTTKPTGKGTGLGLSQVHGFIRQSGGHVRLYSEPGMGTTVKLYLPRSQAEAPAITAPARRAQDRRRRGLTVLVVEDEPGLRDFVAEAVSELGYDVVTADGAETALRQLAGHSEISVLLTDVVMPGTNGRQLSEEALKRRPDLRVMFMTGYTHNAIVHNGVLDPGVRLLSKPFTVAELGAELEDLTRA